MELEADYRSIGIPEIVFVDTKRRHVQIFRKRETDYQVDEFHTGELHFEAVTGFWLDIDWIFDDPRIPVHDALTRIEAKT